jgi:hypothetical protein
MTSRDNFFKFGADEQHCAWTEGDDVVHIEWLGDVLPHDIGAGARAFDLVPNRDKGFILVLHVAKQGRMSAESRKAISVDPRSAWVRDIILVGASFHFRVLMLMVSKALYALGISPVTEIHTAVSEAQLADELARLRKKLSNKSRKV